jgi:hypothetical protein
MLHFFAANRWRWICGAWLGTRAARFQRVLMIANLLKGMGSE